MTNPPKKGEPSYALYDEETSEIFESLKRRAKVLEDGLNAMEGVECKPLRGAMYAFPKISLSEKFVRHARENRSKEPDVLYSLMLLEATGIVVVPGSGFQQAPGTYHFRTTFLPPENVMDDVVRRLSAFHSGFVSEWGLV